jgi:LacI family transcriptional regulator
MAKRAKLIDLADAAGVSIATIDRALNGRETVSQTTRERILAVAQRIGHPAALRLATQFETKVEPREVRLGVVLHKEGQDFYKDFARELQRAVGDLHNLRAKLVLEFSPSQSPADMAASLRSMAGRCDVVAGTGVNHPEVTAAVEDLRAKGIRVFSLLSDFAQGSRIGYLGLNNLKIGRTAGWITSMGAKGHGKLLVFVGGHRFHGHELREAGYRGYLREMAPHLEVLNTIVNLETRQLTYESTKDMLSKHSDLRGIFVSGGGVEGAVAALRESREPGDLVFVAPALTPDIRKGLAEGLVTFVMNTPLEKLCRELFSRMVEVALNGEKTSDLGQIFFHPDIHVAESV